MICRCAACSRLCDSDFLSECLLCGDKFCGVGDCPSTCSCALTFRKGDVDDVFRICRSVGEKGSIMIVFDGAGVCTFLSEETIRLIGDHFGKPLWQIFKGEFCDGMYEKMVQFLSHYYPMDTIYPILCGQKQRYFYLSIINFPGSSNGGGFCVGADVTSLLVGKSKTPSVVAFKKDSITLWRPSVAYDA